MSGVNVKIKRKFFTTVKTQEVKKLLNAIGGDIVYNTRMNFKMEKSPDGKKWKNLSPETQEARRKGKKNYRNKILQDTRNLFLSLNKYKVNGKRVTVGTNVNYAPVHQYGCDKRNIPKREFIGINEKMMKKYEKMITEYIKNLQQKKAK
jgi:phage virion morphogenesis protein